MELIKLVKNPSGAIVASIYKDGYFISRSFYGYSIKAVFSNLRACGCVCSDRLKKVTRG